MKIEILDVVDCRVVTATKEERTWLKKLLSFEKTFYQKKQYGGVKHEYKPSLLSKGIFPAGFIARITRCAENDGIQIEWASKNKVQDIAKTSRPVVPGMALREDQLTLVATAVEQQRGVIESPTGSGKTVSMMGIVSMLPGAKILIVVHTKDLLAQTRDAFLAANFPIEILALGVPLAGHLTVATRQSLVESYTHEHDGKKTKRMRLKERHQDWFADLDAIFIDEVHLFGGMDGQYTALLRSTTCPIRLGFTGTTPDPTTEVGMAVEGMVGPVISRLSYNEAKELDILSTIKLELLPVPYMKTIGALERYRDIHESGIEQNRARNKTIMHRVYQLKQEKITTLVFVETIEHGHALQEMAEMFEINALFVHGEWELEERVAVKNALEAKTLDCVICTKVWREGVNIPSLGAVVLAGGGKAKLSALQAVGRGLRKVEGKKYAIIIDLLDPYDFLAKHTIQRLTLYSKMGWLQ